MKKKVSTLFEVIALAVAGACVTVYSYVVGYTRGKVNGSDMVVGETELAEHIEDIIKEADEFAEETESSDEVTE